MPNHVLNEVIFRDLYFHQTRQKLLAACLDSNGRVDFEILVPSPINIWRGSVGKIHKETFPDNLLDWSTRNWGTKWNAYNNELRNEITDKEIILRFDTAWRPPYGWLVAIFNRFKVSFEHNWLDEGAPHSVHGVFNYARLDDLGGEAWSETPATDELHRHLHFLKWGVESFEGEE